VSIGDGAKGGGRGEWRNEERNEEKGEIFFINATGTPQSGKGGREEGRKGKGSGLRSEDESSISPVELQYPGNRMRREFRFDLKENRKKIPRCLPQRGKTNDFWGKALFIPSFSSSSLTGNGVGKKEKKGEKSNFLTRDSDQTSLPLSLGIHSFTYPSAKQ